MYYSKYRWKVEVRFIDARFYRLSNVYVDLKETLRLSRRKETKNIGTESSRDVIMDRLNDRVLGWVQLWVLRCRKNVRYSLIEELTRLISWKRCFVLYLYIGVGLFFMDVI